MTRDDLLAALQSNNVQAFLRVLRQGESNQNTDAYQIMFGGDHFESFADHPRQVHTRNGLTSSAAGAYQFLSRTWDGLVKQYGFPDFSPINQDCGAVALIAGRKALDSVLKGQIHEAIRLCGKEWASLPGSEYGQPTQALERALATYTGYGGQLADSSSPVAPDPPRNEEVTMAPLIFPLLELAAKFIPQIAANFGSGSEVSNRNLAAGNAVAAAIVEAVKPGSNLQAAVEEMQRNPEAVKAANVAVAEAYPSIFEAGGGGIKSAREAAFSPDQVPFWRNPAFVIALILVPLLYMVAVEILFNPSGQTWSDDIKMMFVTAIVSGLLGSITGFFLGSSLGSQKKDAMLGAK